MPFFLFLFIASIISVIAAWCGWMCRVCYCNNNHCCLMTVVPPTGSMELLHGRYIVNMVVLPLFFPSSVRNIHLPKPDGSYPLLMVTEVSLFHEIIAVPPGL